MYDRWYVVYLIVALAAVLAEGLLVWRRWRKAPEKRRASLFFAALLLVVAVVGAVELPGLLKERELAHYDVLFQADYVEYNGADVTALFDANAGDCWAYRDMEPWTLPKEDVEAMGTLLFYDESRREFAQIQVLRLTEPADGPRIVSTEDGSYVFASIDWAARGYVYGFPEALTADLLQGYGA